MKGLYCLGKPLENNKSCLPLEKMAEKSEGVPIHFNFVKKGLTNACENKISHYIVPTASVCLSGLCHTVLLGCSGYGIMHIWLV